MLIAFINLAKHCMAINISLIVMRQPRSTYPTYSFHLGWAFERKRTFAPFPWNADQVNCSFQTVQCDVFCGSLHLEMQIFRS